MFPGRSPDELLHVSFMAGRGVLRISLACAGWGLPAFLDASVAQGAEVSGPDDAARLNPPLGPVILRKTSFQVLSTPRGLDQPETIPSRGLNIQVIALLVDPGKAARACQHRKCNDGKPTTGSWEELLCAKASGALWVINVCVLGCRIYPE